MPIYTSDVKKTGDAEVHHAGTGATINNKFVFVGSGNNGVQARSNIAFTLGETGEAVPTGTDAYVVSLTNGELKLNSGNAVASGKVVTISFWGIAAGLNKDAGKGFTAVSEDTPEDGDNLVVQTAASSDSSFSSPSAVPVKWKKSTTTLDPAAFSDLTVNGTIQGAVGDWARYSGGAQNENADGALKLAAYKITFKTAASNLIRLNSIGGSNGADHKFLYDLKVIIEDHDDETTSKVASRESLTLQIDKDSTSHPSTAKFSFVAGDAATEVANIDESGGMTIAGDLTVSGNDIQGSAGGTAITFDGSGRTEIVNDLTVSGALIPSSVIGCANKSGNNQAGQALTIKGGAGTGTGVGGSVVIQVADGGTSGTSVNSHATAVTIADDKKTTFAGNVSITGNIVDSLTVANDLTEFTSANTGDPLIRIKNTTNDAASARLQFFKDRNGAHGADDDVIGTILFTSEDSVGNGTNYSEITSDIRDSADGGETSRMTFKVAANTASPLYQGIQIRGSTVTVGKVDIDLGLHSSSLVTVAGDLQVTGNDIKQDDGTTCITLGTANSVTANGNVGIAGALHTAGPLTTGVSTQHKILGTLETGELKVLGAAKQVTLTGIDSVNFTTDEELFLLAFRNSEELSGANSHATGYIKLIATEGFSYANNNAGSRLEFWLNDIGTAAPKRKYLFGENELVIRQHSTDNTKIPKISLRYHKTDGIAAGDDIGQIEWYGSESANDDSEGRMGYIFVEASQAFTNSHRGAKMKFGVASDNASDATNKMVLDQGGNLQIDGDLTVSGNDINCDTFRGTGLYSTGALTLQAAQGLSMNLGADEEFEIKDDGVTKFTFDTDDTPSLDVVGDFTIAAIRRSGQTDGEILLNTGDAASASGSGVVRFGNMGSYPIIADVSGYVDNGSNTLSVNVNISAGADSHDSNARLAVGESSAGRQTDRGLPGRSSWYGHTFEYNNAQDKSFIYSYYGNSHKDLAMTIPLTQGTTPNITMEGTTTLKAGFVAKGIGNFDHVAAGFTNHGDSGTGTNPSTVTTKAWIYAKNTGASSRAELWVKDGNGNTTNISPHNEEGEWEYFSRNTKTGKHVRVNMEKMIRKLEEVTGESFMEEWYEDPEE